MNIFHLPEVKWRKNSALRKPTIGSSVHEGNYGNWDPHYATDGFVQNGGTQIFHSAFEQFPWIWIDLLETFSISFIRVYNRRDAIGMIFIESLVFMLNGLVQLILP